MDLRSNKTAKQRFDEEMTHIKASRENSLAEAEDIPDEEEEQVMSEAAPSEEIGPTQEAKSNLRDLQEAALGNMQRLGQTRRKAHLSSEESAILRDALNSFEAKKIEDPVLKHLIQSKAKLNTTYATLQQRAKQLYQEMLRQMSTSSEDNLKLLGAIENIDRQIVDYLKLSSHEKAHAN